MNPTIPNVNADPAFTDITEAGTYPPLPPAVDAEVRYVTYEQMRADVLARQNADTIARMLRSFGRGNAL